MSKDSDFTQTYAGILMSAVCTDCSQRLLFRIGPRTGQLYIFVEPHDCVTGGWRTYDDNEETFEVTLVSIDDDQVPGGSNEATVCDEEKGTFGDEFEELNPITDLITRIFWSHDCVTGGLMPRAEWEQSLAVRDWRPHDGVTGELTLDRITRAKWEQFLAVRDGADVTIH